MYRVICVCAVAFGAFASESDRPDALVVHEWGTYTSMQGSNGIGVEGLHHGEERLPAFVKARGKNFVGPAVGGRSLKGIDPPPVTEHSFSGCQWCEQVDFDPAQGGKFAVTQKLETPVLYFYSPRELDVDVHVEFPQGLVTEVYPQMSAFSPAFGKATGVANGTADWHVHVHKETLEVPEVESDSIWAPSRRVSANMISNAATKENEHLIFYRGVGQFQSELQVTSTIDTVSIHNTRAEAVSAVFLLESDGQNGFIRNVGAVRGQQTVTAPIAGEQLGDELLPMDLFVTRCVVLLESALMEAGLYPLEARAMVDTWTRSYFASPGVRVLYVSPREWTEALLPMKLRPAPASLERVLVGRVEVMTKAQEDRMVAALRSGVPTCQSYEDFKTLLDGPVGMPALHRFGEAKLRRAVALAGINNAAWIEKYVVEELTL